MRVALPLLLLAAAQPTAGKFGKLRFSWDTVPVFYHSCNFSGPFSDAELDSIVKFPLVTVEKGQGLDLPGYAESKIVAELKRIKKRDSSIYTMFYYNSLRDWTFYDLHQKMLDHPDYWVRDVHGKVCYISGDSGFPNHTQMLSFNFTNPSAADMWISECIDVTKGGHVDGCFSDSSTGTPTCKLPSKAAFEVAHAQVHRDLQAKLGGGKILVANKGYSLSGVAGAMLEMFLAGSDDSAKRESDIQTLISLADQGRIAQAHAGHNGDCSKSKYFTDALAGFLVGAGEYAYFGCSKGWQVGDGMGMTWHEEYDWPLGQPVANATVAGGVYTRQFKSKYGLTNVTYHTHIGKGVIQWAAKAPDAQGR